MDFPFSVKPDKKLSVQDVMAITRDKSTGTRFDTTSGSAAARSRTRTITGTRGPSASRTSNTRRSPSAEAACPTPSAASSGYPSGLRTPPVICRSTPASRKCRNPSRSATTGPLNRDSARWAFDYADFHVQAAYNAAIEDVQEAQAKYEAAVAARIPEIDKQALDLYNKKPAKAAQFIDGLLPE